MNYLIFFFALKMLSWMWSCYSYHCFLWVKLFHRMVSSQIQSQPSGTMDIGEEYSKLDLDFKSTKTAFQVPFSFAIFTLLVKTAATQGMNTLMFSERDFSETIFFSIKKFLTYKLRKNRRFWIVSIVFIPGQKDEWIISWSCCTSSLYNKDT